MEWCNCFIFCSCVLASFWHKFTHTHTLSCSSFTLKILLHCSSLWLAALIRWILIFSSFPCWFYWKRFDFCWSTTTTTAPVAAVMLFLMHRVWVCVCVCSVLKLPIPLPERKYNRPHARIQHRATFPCCIFSHFLVLYCSILQQILLSSILTQHLHTHQPTHQISATVSFSLSFTPRHIHCNENEVAILWTIFLLLLLLFCNFLKSRNWNKKWKEVESSVKFLMMFDIKYQLPFLLISWVHRPVYFLVCVFVCVCHQLKKSISYFSINRPKFIKVCETI